MKAKEKGTIICVVFSKIHNLSLNRLKNLRPTRLRDILQNPDHIWQGVKVMNYRKIETEELWQPEAMQGPG